MPYVDSTSTREQVRAALADNASWEADQDLAKARLYLTAANVWLDLWAFDESLSGPASMRFDELNKGIRERSARAAAFIRSSGSASATAPVSPVPSGSVIRVSVEKFR